MSAAKRDFAILHAAQSDEELVKQLQKDLNADVGSEHSMACGSAEPFQPAKMSSALADAAGPKLTADGEHVGTPAGIDQGPITGTAPQPQVPTLLAWYGVLSDTD